jgi:peptidyl-prolyl cis-trans isomerase SurA
LTRVGATTRLALLRGFVRPAGFVFCLVTGVLSTLAHAQQSSAPVVLDTVVAIVNRQVILASDIDEEVRLSVLDPSRAGQGTLTPAHALEQLISRALINQQLRREDMESTEPTPEIVNARLAEIRRELPACVQQNCATDAGWQAFLVAHELNPERVQSYLRYRLEILGFIEQRFRPGIHISPQEIEAYYKNTLLPAYGTGVSIPTLEKVSPRIEEILLQQQVNLLFDEWLTNLRRQGDVEVLDTALVSDALSSAPAAAPSAEPPHPSAAAPKAQDSTTGEKGKGSQ